MCIYCTTTNYRKIYENHIGPIPKESNGRTYEIHHIDGNHSNNASSNLKAVTLQEHYDIHYAQGDWYACILMKFQRMGYTPEEISNLASKNAKEKVENGTHHFLGNKNPVHKLVENGTHHFFGGEIQSKNNIKRVEEGNHPFIKRLDGSSLASDRVNQGTHHFLGGDIARKNTQKRIDAGTHNFLGGEIVRKNNQKRLTDGTHHFLGDKNPSIQKVKDGTHYFLSDKNPSVQKVKNGTHNFLGNNHPAKIKVCCIWCKKETNLPALTRRHGKEKCK